MVLVYPAVGYDDVMRFTETKTSEKCKELAEGEIDLIGVVPGWNVHYG